MKPELSKVNVSIYPTEDQLQGLKAVATKTRIPCAVLIREGIDMVLEKYNGTPITAKQ